MKTRQTKHTKNLSGRTLPVKGVDWLHNPNFNKGTAFTDAERDTSGIEFTSSGKLLTQRYRHYLLPNRLCPVRRDMRGSDSRN